MPLTHFCSRLAFSIDIVIVVNITDDLEFIIMRLRFHILISCAPMHHFDFRATFSCSSSIGRRVDRGDDSKAAGRAKASGATDAFGKLFNH